MTPIAIPRHIDDQPQVFFWELDEFIVAGTCFAVGVLMGGWFTVVSMGLAWAVVKRFRRYKSGQMEGVLHHILYASGVMSLNKRYVDGLAHFYYY